MKLRNAFSSIILVLASQSVFAQSAMQLVQRDVAKNVKTFARETRLYHYFNMNTQTQSDGTKTIDRYFLNDRNREAWLNTLVESRAGAFWDLNNHNTFKVNAGPGMYLALEPNSSREYGDTLITLDVPQGKNYISTVSTIALKPDTIAALIKEQVISSVQVKVTPNTLGLEKGLTAESLKNMVLPENQNFRLLVQSVFQALDIQFIEYGYKAHQNGFCKGGRQTAIVFTGSKPADQNSTNVMATVGNDLKKVGMSADYLRGFFPEPLNSYVELTTKYRDTVAEIRAKALEAPKVINWPKATAITNSMMTPQEQAYLRSLSFECKTP